MSDLINKEKSWDFIKLICNHCENHNVDLSGKIFENYYRTPEVKAKYEQWKQENRKLLDTLFSDNQSITIRLNDFPYHFETGIAHYVVWLNPLFFNPTKIPPRMNKIVKDYVNNYFKNNEWVHFRNEPNYRTISYIPHYHVINHIN